MSTSILKTRERFERFPLEAKKSLEAAISDNIAPIRDSLFNQNSALQGEILTLKEQLIRANSDRMNTLEEINGLNNQIRQHRYLDDVKRKELELIMFDRRNKHAGGAKNRTEIPDSVPKKFEFPEMPRNFEQRMKAKVANRVFVEPAPLFSKSQNHPYQRGAISHNDNFDDERVADALTDKNRARFQEFYAPSRLAIKLGEHPGLHLEDDYLNKQGLVVPRFQSDMIDEERHLVDVYQNNQERAKALEGPSGPVKPANAYKVDFAKVDRIIERLDAFKERYFDDKRELRVNRDLRESEG